jgi:hypothetical protein
LGIEIKKTVAAMLLVAVCLPVPVASSAFAHDLPRRCGQKRGDGAGWFKVRAHGPVGCLKARRVARRWENKCIFGTDCPRRGAVRIRVEPGYRCRDRQVGFETVRVRCVAEGDRIVHFHWGS